MTELVEPTGVPVVPPDGHTHAWQLRAVEYDDGRVSNCYECEGCDAVWFT
jgi:hypothetical protein